MRKIFKFYSFIIILSLLTSILTISLYLYNKNKDTVFDYLSFVKDVSKEMSENDFKVCTGSEIYDSTGRLIASLKSQDSIKYIQFNSMPEDVINAVVAIEDKDFFKHKGVNWESTIKAGMMEILSKGNSTRGGSTITQQLIKNKYLSLEHSYERKIKEILLALEMEKKFSKDKILEYYLNMINYSNNCIGIETAAYEYFNKSIQDCSLSEIAFLVAIPNNPTYYNPRLNYENTIKRKNTVLHEMFEDGYINSEQYCIALNENPQLKNNSKFLRHNYDASYAIFCATEALMKNNGFEFKYQFDSDQEYINYRENYQECYNKMESKLYTDGLKIKTSLTPDIQKYAQKVVDLELDIFQEKQEDNQYLVQGAATVIDNKTGLVVAIIGGRSDKKPFYTLNRAFQSFQQPGSSIKPLLVYTPIFEKDYSAETIVLDAPIENGPKNSNNTYSGNISIRTAVESSKNTVAWNLLEDVGVNNAMNYLTNMEFSKIVQSDYNLASSLGGLTYGVNTVEMASGYATLANGGIYRKPTCIIDIIDKSGRSLFKQEPEKQIYKYLATEKMTDILEGVAVNGTARGLTLDAGMPFACKTGTTNNYKCAWFCGYTPYYTCAVYVAADNNSSVNGLVGSSYPKFIWKDIQNYLSDKNDIIAFNLPDINNTKTDNVSIDNVGDVGYSSKPIVSDNKQKIVQEDSAIKSEDKEDNKKTNKDKSEKSDIKKDQDVDLDNQNQEEKDQDQEDQNQADENIEKTEDSDIQDQLDEEFNMQESEDFENESNNAESDMSDDTTSEENTPEPIEEDLIDESNNFDNNNNQVIEDLLEG